MKNSSDSWLRLTAISSKCRACLTKPSSKSLNR
ncbi:hypothetical protein CKAH01_19137 [Colletotrichum kahawae]|uniref:Uncharacterized protein n=1 Tax=Colletotrichum kahawae TaxID=34407 RepID=A0AAD9XXC0_COLKA|nr:hypothetical protein CKAH01_19137 [Colletotrichum kahawae]